LKLSYQRLNQRFLHWVILAFLRLKRRPNEWLYKEDSFGVR